MLLKNSYSLKLELLFDQKHCLFSYDNSDCPLK